MKRLFTLLTFFAFITLTSCKKENIAHSGDYAISYRTWQAFKEKSGNSYVYQVTGGSWVGYSWETTITIKEGKAVERSYVLKGSPAGGGPVTILDNWKEDETQLGTHEKGDAAITLDEIYRKAQEDWLRKRDDATTYFEAENEGMISLCGYVPNNCADDCFRGIRIQFIRAL
jgi:hypothetical protein